MAGLLSELYEYVVCYTTIILGIELMFCLPNLPRRPRFGVRCALAIPLYALALNAHLITPPISRTWYMALFALVVFLASLAVLRALFDASWALLFFYGSASYAVEGIVYVARRVEQYFPALAGMDPTALYLMKLVLSAGILLMVWRFLVRRYHDGGVPDVGNGYLLFFVGATLLVTDVLSTGVRIYSLANQAYAVCSLLCYVLLLALEFDVFRSSAVERERNLMRELFHERERQQAATQESIETVNVKFHDLKHQLAALRHMPDEESRERSLDGLEWSISSYDAAVRTGDASIDAILTEKSMQCWARGIDFTCMVDGPCLGFLGVVDAYTLLGNALDNAIEAADKVPDADGRVISLRIEPRAGFVLVCLENSCEGRVALEDGLPRTTKSDAESHGFGLRSVQSIVERHGGNLALDARDGRFSLTILFPVGA